MKYIFLDSTNAFKPHLLSLFKNKQAKKKTSVSLCQYSPNHLDILLKYTSIRNVKNQK